MLILGKKRTMRKPNWLKPTLDLKPEKGKLYRQLVRHDSWCQTLKTGDGMLCNCNPDVTLVEVQTVEDALRPEPDQIDQFIFGIRRP